MTTHEASRADDHGDPPSVLARRGLLAGAGAMALAAGGAGAAGAHAASRQPAARPAGTRGRAGLPERFRRGRSSLVPVANASAPLSGYVYRSLVAESFLPFDTAAGRAFGEYGVYAFVGDEVEMNAIVQVPAGAQVRDLEWYMHNGTGAPISVYLLAWQPSVGYDIVVEGTIPATTQLTTTRVAVPSGARGPFEQGSSLIALYYSFEDGTVQVNGARVGFTQGAGEIGLLPAPVRAYDSRVTGGKLVAGQTRTITLSSSIVPTGASGVLVNVTVTQGSEGGYVKVWPAGTSQPAASSINFATGQTVANALTVGVSNGRAISVYANKAVHIILDVTGTVS